MIRRGDDTDVRVGHVCYTASLWHLTTARLYEEVTFDHGSGQT
jgi:hypothetical protein